MGIAAATVKMSRRPQSAPVSLAREADGPTPERRRHGAIAVVAERDPEGWRVTHSRSVDPLARLVSGGLAEPEWVASGDRFRRDFRGAQFDPLSALDLRRARGAGGREAIIDRIEDARQRVWEALHHLGGLSAPAGSVVWHVVGGEMSLREWTLRQVWGGGRKLRHDVATGILIGALGALHAHYNRPRRRAHAEGGHRDRGGP